MTLKTASMLIDWGFVAAGLGASAFLLARRRRVPVGASETGEPIGLVELAVSGVALAAAAIGPNILVVALTPGQPPMHVLAKKVLIPSIVALVLALGVAVALDKKRVVQRILVGILIGAAATGALDAIRLIGFHYNHARRHGQDDGRRLRPGHVRGDRRGLRRACDAGGGAAGGRARGQAVGARVRRHRCQDREDP